MQNNISYYFYSLFLFLNYIFITSSRTKEIVKEGLILIVLFNSQAPDFVKFGLRIGIISL
ncbi:MAG: hypothetical protein ACXACU_01785, partial [Candidatus Hodarchaeales archaeon]